MASSPQASCLSDPNFAVICAFLERFAKSCGITYPTFVDLQEMLENVEEVPQELVDLHIKLLRKARKTVFLEKWEKALIKFCHTYSSQDGWEIERFGYKKSRLEVKLRALKMLLEGQFDLNNKFKSTINTLESEELRSKPLGKDKHGRIYWLQFDPVSNVRVYREDLDEESWILVAQDRPSLVKLLQELSGDEFPLDLNLLSENSVSLEGDKPVIDTGQFSSFSFNYNVENSGDNKNSLLKDDPLDAEKAIVIEQRIEEEESKTNGDFSEMSLDEKNDDDVDMKQESDVKNNSVAELNNSEEKNSDVAVNRDVNIEPLEKDKFEGNKGNALNDDGTIEEPVMYIVGDGEGEDCLMGNPDKDDQSEEEGKKLIAENIAKSEQLKIPTTKNSSEVNPAPSFSVEKLKPTPKLWSIDTICGVNSSKKDNECVNNDDKPENLEFKPKQKNFSSFSIDSVLEKKNLSSSENSSVSKFSIGSSYDSVPDSVRANEKPDKSISEYANTVQHTVNYAVTNFGNCQVLSATNSLITKHGDCDFLKLDLNTNQCNRISHETAFEEKNYPVKEQVSEDDNLEKNMRKLTGIADEEEKCESNGEDKGVEIDAVSTADTNTSKVIELVSENESETINEKVFIKTDDPKNSSGISVAEKESLKSINEPATSILEIREAMNSESVVDDNKYPRAEEDLGKAKEAITNEEKSIKPADALSQKISLDEENESKEVCSNEIKVDQIEKTEAEIEKKKAEKLKTEVEVDKEKIEKVEIAIEKKEVEKAEAVVEVEKVEVEETKAETVVEKEEVENTEIKVEKDEVENTKIEIENTEIEVEKDEVENTEIEVEKDEVENTEIEVEKDEVENTEIEVEKDEVEKAELKVEEDEVEKKEIEVEKDEVENTETEVEKDEVEKAELKVEKDEVENTEIEVEKVKVENTEIEVEKKEVENTEIEVEKEKVENIEIEVEKEKVENTEIEVEKDEVEKAESKVEKDEVEKKEIEVEKVEVEKARDSYSSLKDFDDRRISDVTTTTENESSTYETNNDEINELEKKLPSAKNFLENSEIATSVNVDEYKEDESVSEAAIASSENAVNFQNKAEDKSRECNDGKVNNENNVPIDEIREKFGSDSLDIKKDEQPEGMVCLGNFKDETSETASNEISPKEERDEIKNEPVMDGAETSSKPEKNEDEEPEKAEENRGGEIEKVEENRVEDNLSSNSEPEKDANKLSENKKRKKKNFPQRVLSRNRSTKIGEQINSEQISSGLEKSKVQKKQKATESNDQAEEDLIAGDHSDRRIDKSEELAEKKDEDEDVKNKEETVEAEPLSEKDLLADACDPVENRGEETSSMPKKGKRISKRRRKRRRRAVVGEKDGGKEGKEKAVAEGEEEEGGKEDGLNKKKGRPKKEETTPRSGGRQIPAREIKLLGIENADLELPSIRQSRRIAQIKMKEEAERRRVEALQLETFKSKKQTSKSRKSKKNADSDSYEEKYGDDDPNNSDDPKYKGFKERKIRKRKKKEKLVFNELNPWLSSSGSSTADDGEEDIEDERHEDEELVFKSDHEFSPESDVEDPDYKPVKRARTAKLEESKEEGGKYDDTSCENCGKNDHPEWILLCDKCDKGWHASCVRPALMVVPEGDWFCPPCEHSSLIAKLQSSLVQYDRCQKQRENEELRKKRLAFVGISLDNVLPPVKKTPSKSENEDKKGEVHLESASGTDSESSSESDDSGSEGEPVYQLRERRSNVTSYRYNEYDELIKSALQDEIEAVRGAGNAGRGKDISNIVNAEKQRKQEDEENEEGIEQRELNSAEETLTGADSRVKEKEAIVSHSKSKENIGEEGKIDSEMETEEENEDDDDKTVGEEVPMTASKCNSKKKKSRSLKITSLDFTSEEEDHNSDSDFKGASSEEESDYSLSLESESSDDRRKKRSADGPLRRSTRARVSRYDRDFINDDSEDSIKRKSRRSWDSSESSDSDRSWGRKKRKGNKSYQKSSTKKSSSGRKRKKQRKRSLDSDREGSMNPKKPKSRKIKYGGLESLDEGRVLARRTRGKKINYQEITGSDSEDDAKIRKSKSSRIIESDDDFVAESEKDEDLQDAESEEDIESAAAEEEDSDKEYGDGESSKKKKKSPEKKKNLLEKMKKKKWVIPDPDDFSEDDLMEDEQLDKLAEELEDLDQEEEKILGNILESGDVPVHELKAAVKRAKDEKKLTNETEEKENAKNVFQSAFPFPAGNSEHSGLGGGKFQKIGKVKITPSRAELASQSVGTPPKTFIPNEIGDLSPVKTGIAEDRDSNQLKQIPFEPDNPASNFLLKNLPGDALAKHPGAVEASMPPNFPFKSDPSSLPTRPILPYSTDASSDASLNRMMVMNSQGQGATGSRGFGAMAAPGNGGPSVPDFTAFRGILSPSRMPSYPSSIPTTVTGMSNLDSQSQSKKKPGPKPGGKLKRKHDEVSSQSENSGNATDSNDVILPVQHGEDFSRLKGVQDSPPKKRGRGRGKKQLLAEAQAQVQGKQDGAIPRGLAPIQFPSQGLPSEGGGSVITRILNAPQGSPGFPPTDSNPFPPAPPRSRLPFPPPLAPHFSSSSPQPLPNLRLRAPAPGGAMFHTSHPLDPSPSGGGAINVPVTSSGLAKPAPAASGFARPVGVPVLPPRFVPDQAPRPMYPPRNSPSRPEFPFANYYASFSQSGSSTPAAEGSAFQGAAAAFPEPFGEEVTIPGGAAAAAAGGGASSKHFEDETSGEFGGLASYFASQREDDIDT